MRKLILLIVLILLLVACSSIDCPLNSRVFTKYKLAGNVSTLIDTLTIYTETAANQDSVLINKDVKKDSFLLPMSYHREQDVFFFEMKDTNQVVYHDTIVIRKEDHPHFEAVDCNPTIFHTIRGIRYTHHRIDSIVLNNSTVNYNASTTHFLIFFKGGRP